MDSKNKKHPKLTDRTDWWLPEVGKMGKRWAKWARGGQKIQRYRSFLGA